MINRNLLREAFVSVLFVSSSLLQAGTFTNVPSDSTRAVKPLSIDGPYLSWNEDGSLRSVSVDESHRLRDTTYTALPADFHFRVTDHAGKNAFQVKLHNVARPACVYKQPAKLFVMSDPHGRFDCFISVLKGNKIIDEQLNWNFGNNHLVIIGDVFDRGNDVLPIFWLIYKLEGEAASKGGCVSFLLGNHEPMVLMNDIRYVKDKYKTLADSLHVDYAALFSPKSVLGQWLSTRNTIQKIGKRIFVHAGLSKELLDKNLSLQQINEQVSKGLYKTKAQRKQVSPLVYFLHGSNGPIWYRGMVLDEEKYNPLKEADLDAILKRYKVRNIVVGHTIFDDISTFYQGKVIAVNVDNPHNKEQGLGRAILIHKKQVEVVGDKGFLRKIK